MHTTTSADGTTIAYDRYGDGPPIVMVAGAFNTRSTTEPLALALEDRFSAFGFDRRGRGDSGDTLPYAVEREIEDLEAVIAEAGGSAAVFGYSSGAILALKAAAHGLGITKLVLYDTPFAVDDSHPGVPADFADRVAELVAAGRRGEAVELYQREAIRIPDQVVVQMRHEPFRPALEAIAHTLVYEALLVDGFQFPTELVASVTVPTLVIDGEQSPPIMHGAAAALDETLPNARRRTLAGQSHDISPEATAAVLVEFLSS
jgi:pimeloyl-ACP methyl ester carboxylesterase